MFSLAASAAGRRTDGGGVSDHVSRSLAPLQSASLQQCFRTLPPNASQRKRPAISKVKPPVVAETATAAFGGRQSSLFTRASGRVRTDRRTGGDGWVVAAPTPSRKSHSHPMLSPRAL